MNRPTMTKAQLQARIISGAKDIMQDMKRQGQRLTFAECKKEMERVLRENFTII